MDPVSKFLLGRAIESGLDKWKERRLRKQQEKLMKQFFQGGLTYSGLAVAALTRVVEFLGVVPEGYTAESTAVFLAAIGAATYGRLRREWRK